MESEFLAQLIVLKHPMSNFWDQWHYGKELEESGTVDVESEVLAQLIVLKLLDIIDHANYLPPEME